MKKCTKCLEEKPFSDFYKRSRNLDGMEYFCKPCKLADDRGRIHKYRATEHGKTKGREQELKSRNSLYYKVQHVARAAVADAVRRGAVVKPDGCWCCGDGPVEAHHSDYSNKLGVTWLCNPCHIRCHQETKIMLAVTATGG